MAMAPHSKNVLGNARRKQVENVLAKSSLRGLWRNFRYASSVEAAYVDDIALRVGH